MKKKGGFALCLHGQRAGALVIFGDMVKDQVGELVEGLDQSQFITVLIFGEPLRSTVVLTLNPAHK